MGNQMRWRERLQYRFARMRAAVQANAGDRVAGLAAVPAVLSWMLRLFGELLSGGSRFRAAVVALAMMLMLVCPTSSRAQSGTYTQSSSGGLWSGTGNWLGGQVATGAANTAYFNTLDITADNTVQVDSTLMIGNLVFGDTATGSAAGWVLDNNGNTNNILTLGTSGGTITVYPLGTGKGVTIGLAISSGSGNINMSSSGTLTLSGTTANTTGLNINNYQNPVVILAKTGGAQAVSGNITVSTGWGEAYGTIRLGGNDQIADAALVTLGSAGYSGNTKLQLMGFAETIAGLNSSGVSFVGGGTGNVAVENGSSVAGTSTLTVSGSGTANYGPNTQSNMRLRDGSTGKLAFTKSGTGLQIFTSVGDLSYTGDTTVNSGTLSIRGSTLSGSAVTLAGGTLDLQSAAISKAITGATGGVNVSGGGNSSVSVGNNLSTYSANTTVSGSSTLTQAAANSFSSNSVYSIAAGSQLSVGNLTGSVKGLAGGGTVSLGGASANLILSDGASQRHTGIVSGTGTLIKVGTGVQTLSGPNTFAGNTVVSNGVLYGTSGSALGVNSNLKLAGGVFAYQPAAAGALALGAGSMTLAAGSRIGTALGGTVSQSAITSLGTATTAGAITVDVYGIPGVTPAVGVNNLIAAGGGLNAATYSLGKVYNVNNFAVGGLAKSDTAITVTVTSTNALTSGFWLGGLAGAGNVWAASDGATAGNWASDAGGTATHLTPGSAATITFSATGATQQGAMTLGANMSVLGLVVDDSSTVALNADGNNLTLGGGGVTVNGGAGAVTLGSSVTLGGAQGWTNNSANTLTVSGPVINGGFLLTSAGTGATVISGALSGTGGVTTTGGGTLTLTGMNSYTGPVAINGGALLVRNSSALGTNTQAIVFGNAAGGLLDIDGYDTTVASIAGGGGLGGNINLGGNKLTTGGLNTSTAFGGNISGAGGSLVKNGTGNLLLSGTNTATGVMTVYQGAVVLSNATGAASCGSLTFDNNLSPDVYTISNNQFAAGALVSFVTDAGDHGRLELLGTTQTVAGIQMVGYTTQRGVIQNREVGPPNSGNSQLILNGSGNYSFGAYLRNSTGTLGVRMDGTGTQTLSGSAINYTGGTVVNNGRLIYLNVGYNSSVVTVNSPGVFEMNLNGTYDNATSTINGNGTLVKTGTGTMRWGSQAGTIAMGAGALVDIQSGLIDAGSSANDNWGANLSSLNIATGAGIYELTYTAAKFDALTGGGTLSGGSSQPLTLGANNTSAGAYNPAGIATFSGVIMDVGSLVKIGTGTQVFTGTNTYTSATTISNGVLVVGGAGRLNNGSYGGTIANSGNLVYNSSTPQTLGGIISGGGSLTENGPGPLSLRGVNTYTGSTTINGGTLSIDGAAQLASGNYSAVITNNTSLVVNSTAAQTLGGVISGTGSLTKSSSGALVLTANNDYSGSTTVNGGSVTLSGVNGSLTNSSAYTIGGNATLKLDNTAAASNTDRLRDAAPITMNSGTLNFSNNGGAVNYSENAGTLSINAGLNTVAASQAGLGQTSALTFPALTHTPGAVVNFVGTGLGVDDRNKILFTSDPSAILGSWATVNGADVAIYDPVLGIKASPYTDIANSGSIVPNAGSSVNVRINTLSGVGGGIDTLGATTTTIGTLLQNSGSCTVDTAGGDTLQAASVMIASGAGALTIGTSANSGTLMANTAGAELVLNNFSANFLTLNSCIADNTSASTLNIGGTGRIILAGTNTYSGGTELNGGTATFNNSAALGTGPVTMNNGAVIDATTAGITLANNPQVWNGSISFAGSQNLNMGAGTVTLGTTPIVTVMANTLTVGGTVTGVNGLTKAGGGTLLFSGSTVNTGTGAITLNAGHTVLSKSAGVAAIGGTLTMVNTASPDVWMTADNQFASGSVLLFGGSGGSARFDLLGTTQTLGGLSEANALGIVQNSEATGGAPSTTAGGTLTLNGAGIYSFNGTLRNQTGTLTVNMNGTGTQTFNLAGSGFRIGGSYAGDCAAFNVNSGTVIVPNNCVFNENGGSAGTLTINGGTFSQTGGGFYMPNSTGGPSYLTVNGGSFISVGNLYTQSSTGTTTINGGTLAFAGQMRLGEGGTGNWVQTGGSARFGAESYIALGANPGTMTISGGTFDFAQAGQTWFNLGYGTGLATLNITSNGTFKTTRLLVGRDNTTSQGLVNMTGGTFTASGATDFYYLGHVGTSTWNQTGGVATFSNWEMKVGSGAKDSTITVNGGTFSLPTSNWLRLSAGTGTATLNVGNTGYFRSQAFLAGDTSRAFINISGGTIDTGLSGQIYSALGNTGSLVWNQTGGTAIFQGETRLAQGAASSTLTLSSGTINAGAGANWFNVGYGTGLATMTVNDGYFGGNAFIIARDQTTSRGVVNLNSGTIAIGNNNPCYISHAGTATWNQTGGVATFGSQVNVAQNIMPATITVNGGLFSQTAPNIFYLGVGAGTATFNVGGSGVVNLYQLLLANGATSKGVVNLNGGTLQVRTTAVTIGSGTGTINFNGGTFQAVTNVSIVSSASLTTSMGAGGGVFDTQNYTMTVNNPLTAGGAGGLTKVGTGTLVLAGATNTFTGATTVNAGTLVLTNSMLAGTGTITLNTNAIFRMGLLTNAVNRGSVMVMNGGTLDATSTNYLVGAMGVGANGGTILMGTNLNATLQFMDSSAVVWSNGVVDLVGTLGPTSLRFGVSHYGLTGEQKNQLVYGGKHVSLDEQGYVILASGTLMIIQ